MTPLDEGSYTLDGAVGFPFLAAERGLPYIHPFDADMTVSGQGTLGLELLEDVPDMDAVQIAIGGGGLVAGMANAIKLAKPQVRIIGVEPVGAPSMQAAV